MGGGRAQRAAHPARALGRHPRAAAPVRHGVLETRQVSGDAYVEIRGTATACPWRSPARRPTTGDRPAKGWVTVPAHHATLWADTLAVERRPLAVFERRWRRGTNHAPRTGEGGAPARVARQCGQAHGQGRSRLPGFLTKALAGRVRQRQRDTGEGETDDGGTDPAEAFLSGRCGAATGPSLDKLVGFFRPVCMRLEDEN
jgi:hypothetical protein